MNERIVGVFMPVGTPPDDPTLLQRAKRCMDLLAARDGVSVESGPTYRRTVADANARVLDTNCIPIYDKMPPGMTMYEFTWTTDTTMVGHDL